MAQELPLGKLWYTETYMETLCVQQDGPESCKTELDTCIITSTTLQCNTVDWKTTAIKIFSLVQQTSTFAEPLQAKI